MERNVDEIMVEDEIRALIRCGNMEEANKYCLEEW